MTTEYQEKRLDYLSKFIKELRFANGLTQLALGRKANLSRNTIVRLENSKNISIKNLLKISDALDIDIVEMFENTLL